MWQFRRCFLVGLTLIVMTGCHDKVANNGNINITFSLWVPLLLLIGGLAAVPIGILLVRKRQRFWGITLLLVGPLVGLALAPGMFQDRVTVNQEGFYSRHGFWWDPTIHEIKYDHLAAVRITIEERTGRRGRKSYSYYFDCSFKSGQQERVPLGDLMKEALPDITEQFRQHGVQVVIPSNLPE